MAGHAHHTHRAAHTALPDTRGPGTGWTCSGLFRLWFAGDAGLTNRTFIFLKSSKLCSKNYVASIGPFPSQSTQRI